jgi:glycosyltransferase involved in cell wall biosynthesis
VTEAFYDVFAPVPSDLASKVTTRYGLRRPYLLFVSTLYPYKNVETLIRSLAHLVTEKGVDWELVIVGRDYDSQQPRLQSLARDLGVSERTRFLGFVPTDDLPALYSAAQAFVFPSLVETFGKPLVEAMRCGVPVIASNTSCIPEVLGGAGILVDPLDVEQMASAIHEAAVNQILRTNLIEHGLKRALFFSWEAGAKETLSTIERAFHEWSTKLH